jgi:hypothetical protein
MLKCITHINTDNNAEPVSSWVGFMIKTLVPEPSLVLLTSIGLGGDLKKVFKCSLRSQR